MFSLVMRAVHANRHPHNEPQPGVGADAVPVPDPDDHPFPHDLDHDASPGPATLRTAYPQFRAAAADFTEADDDEDDSIDDGGLHASFHHADERLEEDEDGRRHSSHVLPLFSASHLDSLPVYSIVHAMRIIIQARTETTLTWEQLRSPQVSQFLVKPMQQQIRTQHFSRATLYALMANCLQFAKEAQFFPGNAGTSNTRAKVCELLAIKLLKEYTTRELIDALSYDFNPLQGIPSGPLSQHASSAGLSRDGRNGRLPAAARTSTLEVAIRASAKHFLAHPLVVQQLDAIWNGAISFYSSADSLHRSNGKAPAAPPPGGGSRGATWMRQAGSGRGGLGRQDSANDPRTPLLSGHVSQAQGSGYHDHHQQHPAQQQAGKEEPGRVNLQSILPAEPLYRRTVTLYDPRNASLFKLSRLRVPRYRQFFSTCSLAVLIGLFLAVLVQHSSRITSLELVFWFWSAGFMLDELVGFNEQGFSLYIMSFWNIFDLGILLLLIFYYSLRICGVFLADAQRWNNSAYDILAANAILLLPRFFSVLDHYQYFSQLLIAFRLMAIDLAAVFILILVACSGFFVFFTLSRTESDASDVAYRIFQLLMGFTPAAWEVWPTYNILGKTLMVLFLIICHFVVVTILITVLTNSFMTIASNANEEHQFLFAINTISMVKNDALFSYVAPTNIFAWMLMPLRYCMPLPHFVALNRLVIKATHLPLLFGIFVYEKFFLAPFMYEPTDLVENHQTTRHRGVSFVEPGGRPNLFSPSIRVREESVVGYQKDRALDEVFRRTPDIATLRTQRRNERRKTQTAIRNWMDQNYGFVDSPHNMSTVESRMDTGWQRRMSVNRDRGGSHRFRHMSDVRSAASDPADLLSLSAMPVFGRERRTFDGPDQRQSPFDVAFKDHTDAEGDDELLTHDDDEEDTTNIGGPGLTPLQSSGARHGGDDDNDNDERGENDGDFFATPVASRFLGVAARSPESPHGLGDDKVSDVVSSSARNMDNIATAASPPKLSTSRKALHFRALSSNTILYNPSEADSGDDNVPPPDSPDALFLPLSPKHVPEPSSRSRPLPSRHRPPTVPGTPTTSGQRSPQKPAYHGASTVRPRPILPPREPTQSTAGSRAAAIFNTAALIDTPVRRVKRRMSSYDIGSDTQSELLTASAVGAPPLGGGDGLPGSFVSQLALASAIKARAAGETDHDRDRMSRLVLARMKTLEESFTDVVRELRSLQKQQQYQSRETFASGHVSSAMSSSEGEVGGADKPAHQPPAAAITQAHSVSNTPKSTSASSRIPVAATTSASPGMSSPPPGSGQLQRAASSGGLLATSSKQIPQPAASGGGSGSDVAGLGRSRVLRSVKGKGVDRRPVVETDDNNEVRY